MTTDTGTSAITHETASNSQAWRRERFHITTGYAVGYTDGGEWLTILGSHWETIPLFPTAALAEEWFAARWTNSPPRPYVTKLVARVGSYFKIVNARCEFCEGSDIHTPGCWSQRATQPRPSDA